MKAPTTSGAVLAALLAAACGDAPAPRPVGEVARGAPIAGDVARDAPDAVPAEPPTETPPLPAPPRPDAPLPPLGDVTPPSETVGVDDPPVVSPTHPPAAEPAPAGGTAAVPGTGTQPTGAVPPRDATADGAKPPDAPQGGLPEKPPEKPAEADAAAKEPRPAADGAPAAEGTSAATARAFTFETLASFEYLPPDPEVAGSDIKSLASIPEEIKKLDGTWAKVDGYMLPLEYEGDGVKAFLLSRHQMGCCFGVLPKPNELVEVEMPEGQIAPYVSYMPVVVTGKLRVGPREGASTVLSGIYRLESPKVEVEEEDDTR